MISHMVSLSIELPALGALRTFTARPSYEVSTIDWTLRKSKLKVVFATRGFNPKEHSVDRGGRPTKEGSSTPFSIDGGKAWGCEANGVIPRTQLVKLVVYWDGRRISLPYRLFGDCFNPHTRSQESVGGSTYVSMSKQGSLVIGMSGSDSSTGYFVLWNVPRHGKPSRLIGGEEIADKFFAASSRGFPQHWSGG